MSIVIPTCPTDCTGLLPEVSFSDCAPEYAFGQIKKIYIAKSDAANFTNVEDAAEWAARLSLAGVDPDAIRPLTVVGSKPAPEYTTLELSNNRKVVSIKTHTVDFKIDEVNEENYEFLRAMECGQQVKAWYATDDYIYGGTDGISASIYMDDIIPEGIKELETFTGKLQWDYRFHPERNDNPL
jgi:hypothetical protein